ncbi:MAG: recombination mediator RecR [Patescibacteria group bacterium]
MRKFPAPIHNLVAAFSQLPGVGPKTALRYVFALLRLPQVELEHFSRSIMNLSKEITVCKLCKTYSERTLCELCEDSKRRTDVLCVVAEPRDISTIELTGTYHGHYFVLGGLLNPVEGVTPDVLHIHELLARVANSPELKEVILAFSPNVHGETTMLYLAKQIHKHGRRATKLARGLPLGADLEFADEITLGEAMMGRKEI